MAILGAGGLTVLMVLVWPLIMLEAVKFDGFRFLVWTTVSQIWTYLAAAYIVIVPLYEEVREVYGQYLVNKAQRERHMPRSARQRSARARGPGAPVHTELRCPTGHFR